MNSPPRVCLAISAYRSDDSVGRLLESALSLESPPFEHLLVVDSLGSGKISELISARGWGARVEYRSFPTNLGSAGNLAQRLRIPAEQGFDFVYALNHDGKVAPDVIRALVEHALTSDRIGAVYPLRRYPRREGVFDLTGATRFPIPAVTSRKPPAAKVVAAKWGSSNGALYATRPLREGLRVLDELWLGWEDLALGWSLEQAGYTQAVVTSAVLEDDYEYSEHRVGPIRKVLSDKPSWYSYYVARNLILAARLTHQDLPMHAAVAVRTFLEFGITLIARKDKAKRLQLLVRGVIDGLLGHSGKGAVP